MEDFEKPQWCLKYFTSYLSRSIYLLLTYLMDSLCINKAEWDFNFLHVKLLPPIPTGSKSLGDESFYIAGPKLCNSIPINIRYASSITIFRRRLKTFLLL